MTEGSLAELGFQRWLPIQEVAGRPEARPRRRYCSEFDHLGHRQVAVRMVGVNEVHQETQFVENSRRDVIGSQCKLIRTGVTLSVGLVSAIQRYISKRFRKIRDKQNCV